jgi:hypothetical protein
MSYEEMSNSKNESPLSSLKSFSKYFCHMFLISLSLVRSPSVSSLMYLNWMMFVVFLSLLLIILSTLYCSILSALLYRCIHLNHTFFSLIAFCTFLFHHHISLALCLPHLVTPNSSENHFSNASGHLYLHAICILSFMLRTFLKNSLLERLWCLFFKFPPLRSWRMDALTPLKAKPKANIRYHKLMLRHDTLARYHLTIYASVTILFSLENKINVATILIAAKSY